MLGSQSPRWLMIVTLGLVLLPFALPLVAQNSGPAQTPIPGGGFRIGGRVVNALGGSALSRARVVLVDAKNPENTLSTTTSEEGNFEFLQLPAGKYGLGGAKRGFIASGYEQHEQFSTAIVTGAGFDTEHLVLRLAPFAVLSGKVLDESGEPVRQAALSLYREDRRVGVERIQKVRQENTDDRGTYEFSALDAGTYFLSADAIPWYAVYHRLSSQQSQQAPHEVDRSLDVAYPMTYYKDVAQADEALPIPIRGGDHLEADIHISPVPALHLLFHVPNNRNSTSAYPTLLRPTFDGMEDVHFGSTEMVSPSVYAVTGIAPGAYTVRIPGSGQENPVDVNMDITEDGQELDPSKGEPLSTVKATVHIAGEETLPPQLNVALRNSKLKVVGWRQADAKGEVEFNDLAPGKYEVLVFAPQKAYSLVSISSKETEIPGHILSVTAGSSMNVSLSVVGSAMNVEGFARRNGKPFAGAMVVLVPNDPESNRTLFRRDQSDMDGSFNLLNVIPGTYTIVAIEDGWDLDWASPGVIASYSQHGKTLTVGGNKGSMRVQEPVEVLPK
jgi:Carboxypeptidase regulatory-like domain